MGKNNSDSRNIRERIKKISADLAPTLIKIRRRLHEHPELSYQEFETTKYLTRWLKKTSAEIRTEYAETGVVGVLRGSDSGPVVALRGVIDALPIKETTGLPFASKNPGVMHACGHDSHATMTLGAALILAQLKDELNGSVKIILQPGEEKNPGGASIMVKNGVLTDPDVDVIFGIHSDHRLAVGHIGYREGVAMAAADEFYITIKGKGGHGAFPHLAVDPIVIAAQVVLGLQKIRSRMVDPHDQVVVTVGKISGGKTTNVIPDKVKLIGTIRTFKPGLGQEVDIMMRRMLQGITHAYGAEFDLKVDYGSPALINDKEATHFLLQVGKEYFGRNNCHFTEKPSLGGEDFSFYLEQVPGSFFRIGTGNPEKGISAYFHESKYDIDEAALPMGAGFYAFLAYSYLAKRRKDPKGGK